MSEGGEGRLRAGARTLQRRGGRKTVQVQKLHAGSERFRQDWASAGDRDWDAALG